MRTEVAGGAPRYAMDYDRGPQQFNVTMILDAEQMMTWTLFYHHVIKKGAISFTMELDSGMGHTPHACNILPGSYNMNRVGWQHSSISFVVEAEATAYSVTTADAIAFVEFKDAYGDGGSEYLGFIGQFATVDSTVLGYP
nr:hypothetical protein [uncultured Rhodoferax sp.]